MGAVKVAEQLRKGRDPTQIRENPQMVQEKQTDQEGIDTGIRQGWEGHKEATRPKEAVSCVTGYTPEGNEH